MVDKRFPLIYSVILSFFTSIMVVLMILLWVEYRFFCREVQQLFVLKEQYAHCINVLNKKIDGTHLLDTNDDEQDVHNDLSEMYEITEDIEGNSSIIMDEIAAAEGSDDPDNDDDYVDDSFIIINRQPDYLKQSTLDYIESQELNALMTAIDIDRWSDYTDSPFVVPQNNRGKSKLHAQLPNKSATTSGKKSVVRPHKDGKKIIIPRAPLKESDFVWPIDTDKFWLSSLFGPRKRINGTWGFHHGIDMAAIKGTVVKAARAGTVVDASCQAGYGNTVLIKHSESLTTRYAHLHVILVANGQKIKQGTIVGKVGETGFVRKKGKDGSHLHFELYENGKRVNPMHCLPRIT